MEKFIINRSWSMPSRNTFSIKPINNLIERYLNNDLYSIDPFANSNTLATVTNDLDPIYKTDFNLDAIDFLDMFAENSVDLVLFDPPYSPRQVSESYRKLGKTVDFETTQSSYWSNLKNKIDRIVKPNGIVISFAWNSNGMGKNRSYEIVEILLVAHGGYHNDTIVMVEKKRI